jgi:hypothetical protein
MSKKKSVSDTTLTRLWSKAVRARDGRCPITGAYEDLQAHHVIHKGRQRRFALRWDVRNGVALSHTAHRELHDGNLQIIEKIIEYVRNRGDLEYLEERRSMYKHELLLSLGMSENEYRIHLKNELEELIDELD